MSNKNINIYKNHGGREKFSRKKLFSSLKRSGLPHKQCQSITDKVARKIAEGAKTKEIFRKALHLVNKNSRLAGMHYSLKRAIFELGPTGHHFEKYVAKYFKAKGFRTKTSQILQGRLVSHEVDVVAKKNNERIFVECKFHNRAKIKNDIKVALYVKARRDDLKEGLEGKNLHGFYLASNTAFSLDAITYANGSNILLLGVNAPAEKSFADEIKEMGLYPITSLRGIKKIIRNELLDKDVILAKELPDNIDLLLKMGMSDNEINKLFSEIKILENQ